MIMTGRGNGVCPDDYDSRRLFAHCVSSVHCIGCLGGGVGGDNESWAPLVHTQSQLPGGDSGKLETH